MWRLDDGLIEWVQQLFQIPFSMDRSCNCFATLFKLLYFINTYIVLNTSSHSFAIIMSFFFNFLVVSGPSTPSIPKSKKDFYIFKHGSWSRYEWHTRGYFWTEEVVFHSKLRVITHLFLTSLFMMWLTSCCLHLTSSCILFPFHSPSYPQLLRSFLPIHSIWSLAPLMNRSDFVLSDLMSKIKIAMSGEKDMNHSIVALFVRMKLRRESIGLMERNGKREQKRNVMWTSIQMINCD